MWIRLPPMPAAYPNELAALPDVFTYQDAKGAAVSDRRLKRGVDEGWLVKVGHGVYCRADAQLADLELVEVALRAPDATLCLASALARHELSDTIPSAIHVALPRSRRPPVVESVVEWHRFSDETFALGRMPLAVADGVEMGIYSPERCVVDAFRLRHQEGSDVANEALRRWLRRRGSKPASLMRLASFFPKAEPGLRAALEVLL